jgi:transposase-like protein
VTDSIESVSKPMDAQQLTEQLVERARAEGIDLIWSGGLLVGLTKTVLETVLDAAIPEHLGYAKHDPPAATPATASTRSCCR